MTKIKCMRLRDTRKAFTQMLEYIVLRDCTRDNLNVVHYTIDSHIMRNLYIYIYSVRETLLVTLTVVIRQIMFSFV